MGLLTMLRYQRSCWIGSLVVERRVRGRGVGEALVVEALRRARAMGAERVGLFSKLETARFYERLGFRGVRRWILVAGSPRRPRAGWMAEGIVRLSARLLPEVIWLDRRAFGEERGVMVAELARDFGQRFLVFIDGGRAAGFIVGKPGRGFIEVGPWVCLKERREAARELFLALSTRARGRVELYVPSDSWVGDFLRGLGMRTVRAYIEMSLGESRGSRRAGVRWERDCVEALAAAGLEKG